MSETAPRRPHLTAVRRDGAQVTALELFFDLVFVLAITQCTALMASEHSWEGVAKGMLVLGAVWWAWVGYAWLTSVVDPEEGAVRIAMFAAMAALLVVGLCVPEAFEGLAVTFTVAYAVVRLGQIALFVLASGGDPGLRASVVTLGASTLVGVGLLGVASQVDGVAQGLLWTAAIGCDMAGPFIFRAEGWQLVPSHFAERHGLIVLIALGESIVAIGVGAEAGVDGGVIAAAVLGVALAAALWWAYFDVVAIFAGRRLEELGAGKRQNEMARDSYSYLHFPMIAGIVLTALGLKNTLAHVGDPLDAIGAFAMVGGPAMYLLAHVAFRWRNIHTLNRDRMLVGVVLAASYPIARELTALATLSMVTLVAAGMIAYETVRFAEGRDQIRHQNTPTEAT